MSTGQRVGSWARLALLAASLVQAACGGGDDAGRRHTQAVTSATEPVAGIRLYGIAGTSAGVNSLVALSTTSGAQTVVGTAGAATESGHGADFDPSTGELFAVNGATGTPGQLRRIDLVTGQSTPVGIVRDAAGQAVTLTGLTFAADGTLYVATLGEIGRVHRTTLVYTPLMTVPADQILMSIDLSPSGVLYAAYHHRTTTSQTLLSIDPVSMTVTRQIPIVGDYYVGDIDAAADGYLYHTNYGLALVRLLPATGQQIQLGIGQVGALSGVASIGNDDPTALFDWAERAYAAYFPSHQANQSLPPYVYRFYPETGNYLGVNGHSVVVLGPISNGVILEVGQVADFICQFRPGTCSLPVITSQPADASVAAPASVSFKVAASGTPSPAVQWQVSVGGGAFADIAGATSTTLTLASTTAADAGKRFRAIATNRVGPATSAVATLYLSPPAGVVFTPLAGRMTTPRANHTATTLLDGKVLIAGGFSASTFPGPALDTVELFDPASGTFSALTARMRSPRTNHAAALLPDGKVLISGGQADNNNGDGVDTAEVFDPSTRSFTSLAARMNSPRGGHSATTLPNGKVLVAGGFNRGPGTLTVAAEIFDPTTRTFAPLSGQMIRLTNTHRGTLLYSGNVLISGGVAVASAGARLYRDLTEQFDTSTQIFGSASAPMTATRIAHDATTLPGGWLLMSGGATSLSFTNVTAVRTAELFNPATRAFTSLGITLSTPRAAHAAARLADGSVLLTGGLTVGSVATPGIVLDSAEVFRVATPTAKPTVTLTAEPTTLTLGGSLNLLWSSTLADSCAAYGSWSGTKATSGTQAITPTVVGNHSFSLFCTGAGGTSSVEAVVAVTAPVAAPTVSLTASAASAPAGSTVTLQWSSTQASTCSASGDWSGNKATLGSEGVSTGTTAGTRTFKITCTGAGGTASATVSVGVTAIACAQIGGTWTETARVTGTCDPPDSFDSGDVTGTGTIVQNGCDISYTVAGVQRTGKVSGFSLTITGPAAVAGPDITLTANTLTITGTISADARRITATGVGQLGGYFADGFTQMCTLKSTSTMTR